jgi:phospholipid transport system transporter-binding protein
MSARQDLFGIRALGPGQYVLEGELSFASVGQALRKTAKLFAAPQQAVFDLAGIAKADSAGLALLLEWLRRAGRAGVELHYANVPRQLLAMAQVAGVDGILILD